MAHQHLRRVNFAEVELLYGLTGFATFLRVEPERE